MGKIYTSDGWPNWDYLYNECRFIMTVTGGRGTGKTYGLLKYTIQNKIRFIYIRRLKAQLDACVADDNSNPFKPINAELDTDIYPQRYRGNVTFYDATLDHDNPVPVGYGAALSTVATIRGSDYSDVDLIIFDEYIAMSNEKPIKNEAEAFLNFVETVNRNRELFNRPPVKIIMLGNANKLMNPYFVHWHFMRTALRMIHGRQMMWRSADNQRIMVLLLDSPISARKRETALYKDGTKDFIRMALDNAFSTDETTIKTAQLTDLKHIVSIGEIGIYQRKSDGRYYCSETVNKSLYYDENEINIKIFRARFGGLKTLYLYGYFTFESYDSELIFREFVGV